MPYYYINSAMQQVGPLEPEQLRVAGITRDTLVWKEGMKDWTPAGKVDELMTLFAAPRPEQARPTPPPVPGKVNPPPVPATPPAKSSPPVQKTPSRSNLGIRKILVAAAAGVVVLAVALFFVFRDDEPRTQVYIAADADTARDEEPDMRDTGKIKQDSAKVIDLDSLANNLKWDTTVAVQDTAVSNGGDVSFLPGFGSEPQKPKANTRKTTARKKTPTTPREESSDVVDDLPEQQRSSEPEKINPARNMTITGTFRKNLIFEAILEGTINNRNNMQLKDIIVEVWFLDASGQSVGTKRFTQHGPVPAGSSIPFRFKCNPPKGAKGARYEIASASR